MQDEQRKLRQLAAATRLRALQREKAASSHAACLRSVRTAERRLEEEQQRYRQLQATFEQQSRAGVALDPAQYEQRLLAQSQSFIELTSRVQALREAQEQESACRTLLGRRTLEVQVTQKAFDTVLHDLQCYLRNQESIDIFDAQQALGASHGA
ncbi:hypothetical protein [Pseudomonas palleroniana]|uniref:Uncharacterized protein n=1 Tax=Pseudomonas palleroniana TaxID=191390 RepID=A0A109FQN0_9PSED|nr:hypothetical protein [Pseudomonas palleroniana]KWU52864.1 hypothetical protein AWV77_00915 [Pseudomonas palleroniana]